MCGVLLLFCGILSFSSSPFFLWFESPYWSTQQGDCLINICTLGVFFGFLAHSWFCTVLIDFLCFSFFFFGCSYVSVYLVTWSVYFLPLLFFFFFLDGFCSLRVPLLCLPSSSSAFCMHKKLAISLTSSDRYSFQSSNPGKCLGYSSSVNLSLSSLSLQCVVDDVLLTSQSLFFLPCIVQFLSSSWYSYMCHLLLYIYLAFLISVFCIPLFDLVHYHGRLAVQSGSFS